MRNEIFLVGAGVTLGGIAGFALGDALGLGIVDIFGATVAAWVQAIGVIVALGVAIYFPMKEKKERNREDAMRILDLSIRTNASFKKILDSLDEDNEIFFIAVKEKANSLADEWFETIFNNPNLPNSICSAMASVNEEVKNNLNGWNSINEKYANKIFKNKDAIKLEMGRMFSTLSEALTKLNDVCIIHAT